MPSPHPRVLVAQLLAELDPLDYPARMRVLAASTRRWLGELGPGGLRGVLDALEGQGGYGRRLAALAAVIGRDHEFLAARLSDEDATVRGVAVKASLRLPMPDAAIERALDDAPAVVRRQLVAAVVKGGRTALADRLLDSLREAWGDEEAARLLPGCTAETVARLLPELFTAVTRWQPLGRRHPDLLLDEVARQLAELPESSRQVWWGRNAAVFGATAEARPERVLELLDRHAPAQLPFALQRSLAALLRAAPRRTLSLLTAPERTGAPVPAFLSRTALNRLALKEPQELVTLGRAWAANPQALARLLRALPPHRRAAFFDAVTAEQDLAHAELAPCVLDALPRARAHVEARRMAEQARVRGAHWSVVLGSVAYLPPAETRPSLLDAVRRNAAEDRALAYPLLIANAARSGEQDAVTAVLTDLQRIRNEQEPVRSPALEALATIPARLFADACAPMLDRLVIDAVEARDFSLRSRQALSRLALAVLREHAVGSAAALVAWALSALERLSGRLGGADLGRLDLALRRGQERQVFEALRPWLRAGAKKADYSLALALTRALGRRAEQLPELQELLGEAVRIGNDATVRQAVGLWLEPCATRDQRVETVLSLDPSAVALPPVLRIVTHRRTDLLDRLLGDVPPYGRFLSHGTSFVPPVRAARIWLPRQQQAAARLLGRAIGDASLPTGIRAAHLRAAAALPGGLGLDIVRRFLDSTDTVLAEAALGALVWTEQPAQALPLLLAHAGDDRARVALYAAGRASAHARPSELQALLRAALLPATQGAPTPAAKVTSRKELVRLAARRLPLESAAAIVAETFALPDQHPDVQAACVGVATELLPLPSAWTLLEQGADGGPAAQTAVLRIAWFQVRREERGRYGRLVGRIAQSADVELAAEAFGRLPGWAPWYPQASPLLVEAATRLDNRTSWRSAADGLVAVATSKDDARPLLDALARLIAAERQSSHDVYQDSDPEAAHDAGPDRDHPARQRIAHLLTRLTTALTMSRSSDLREAARPVIAALTAEPELRSQAAELLAHALDLDAEPARLQASLEPLIALLAGRPVLATRIADTLRRRLNTARLGDPLTLLCTAQCLTAEPEPAAGFLALGIVGALGPRTRWSQEWRALLRTLRRHTDADVRMSALEVFIAHE